MSQSLEPRLPITAALYVYPNGESDVLWAPEWEGRLEELAAGIRMIGERMTPQQDGEK